MVSDLKKKQTLVQELYDADDEIFVNALKLTGALTDPFVAELVRRVLRDKNAMDLMYQMYEDERNVQELKSSNERLVSRNASLQERNQELLSKCDAVCESFKNAAPKRPGGPPLYLPFVKEYIATYGPTQKASLISAMVSHWPKKRVAISTSITRAVKRGDLKESSNGCLRLPRS